jgi:hypothetical protein
MAGYADDGFDEGFDVEENPRVGPIILVLPTPQHPYPSVEVQDKYGVKRRHMNR